MTTKKTKPNGTSPVVLDAKALLDEAPKLPVQAIHVPEMSVGERDEYETAVTDSRQGTPDGNGVRPSAVVRAALLVRTLCDADGVRLFTSDQTEALAETLGARVGARLFEVACRLNGIGALDVEELEKN